MSKHAIACVLLLCLAIGTSAKGNTATPKSPAATYPDWASAIKALNSTPGNANLSTLLAALNASGVVGSLNSSTAWTILAPTDAAFASRLKEDLNKTAAQILTDKDTLIRVLSYHVIPSGAILSTGLKNGQNLTTALAGAAPLTVQLRSGKKPRFVGATNTATVVVADIKIGSSVVHVVNDLLLPAGIGKGSGKNGR